MRRLDHYWYSQNPVAWLLLPLAGLFCVLSTIRRLFYKLGWLQTYQAPFPVIIVGNISVGGTGKTPLLINLCNQLKEKGYRPGIISRGYGGNAEAYPLFVTEESEAADVGDEPLLLAQRTQCPIAVGPDRIEDIDCLLAEDEVNIILADDGMQHYRLERDAEIAVIDASRYFGNGFCIPSGPLREPISRLNSVDMVVLNGGEEHQISFKISAKDCKKIGDDTQQSLTSFSGQQVHAVAGIGNPDRFFKLLESHGIKLYKHEFADHHAYQEDELNFDDNLPVLMTEKDAVKCRNFGLTNLWYVPVDVTLSASAQNRFEQIIEQVCNG